MPIQVQVRNTAYSQTMAQFEVYNAPNKDAAIAYAQVPSQNTSRPTLLENSDGGATH